MKCFVSVIAGAMLLAAPTMSAPTEGAETAPSFAKDVAPILYENCIVCHRPGEVAPMSLISYESVRPWSRAIKEKVVAREMPPWFADAQFGQFRNERRLTQEQINTIVAWVDGGAPKGNETDLPALPEFATGWADGGDPDYVFEMPVEFQLPTEGEIAVTHWYVEVPFQEDKFAEAIELRPGNSRVVHHAGGYVVQMPEGTRLVGGFPYGPDGQAVPRREIRGLGESNPATEGASKLVSYVPGRGLERYQPGTAKRILPGTYIDFNMHYQATGVRETDRSRLGLWWAKGPVTHEILNNSGGEVYIVEGRELAGEDEELAEQRGGGDRVTIPNIPPHAENWKIVGIRPFVEDVTLHGLSPHMHLRGKDMTYTVVYPDGREEIVLSVPKYDFNWQLYYELETPLKIPGGSKLVAIAHYDNSVRNRYNPAPDKEVYWAEQSWDEMFGPQIRMTVDSQDLTKKPKGTTN